MHARLLGPVDVVVGGTVRPVPGLRRQATLAVLALNRGLVVTRDHLIEAVWDGSAPDTALNTLQRTVSHLRALIGDRAAIVARPSGYLLTGDGEPTDLEQVRQLVARGGTATDLRERVRLLTEALAHWRGPSLADVAALRALEPQARRLDGLRLQATQDLVDARLALGEHAQLLPELHQLAADHPFDERTHAQLILALYRAGRQAEALGVAQRLRTSLRDELGVDPGPDLRELETAVLRQEVTVTAEAAPTPPPVRVPALLPPSVYGFAGRGAETDALDAVRAEAERLGGAMVIATVVGGAGVGKTSLAVHWAHRVSADYPDGQLYVNLHGFGPGPSATDPAEAVRGFLGAFDVPVARIPVGLDAQVALYRSLLAGRRVLIVLDNARDAEQVRPLLPGSPGCLVVVTSRNQLTPLVAAEGARPLPLGLLGEPEAYELLVRRLGEPRVAAEPDAVREIVARCARLPLALAIAAARAAIRPRLPLAALAGQLREAAGALDTLTAGDQASDIRRVFSWSYEALSPGAARLFRLLGPHPGPDVGTAGAASLAGVPEARAAALLDELAEANLLTEQAPGRYVLHDLLRAHARELAGPSGDALERAYDHYLHTAQTALHTLHGSWCDLPLPPPAPGATPERPTDIASANAWLGAEHHVLLAAVGQAAEDGFPGHAWRLAWTLTLALDTGGFWHEYVQVQRAALAAVRDSDDLAGRAHANHGLGRAYTCAGSEDDARRHLAVALDEYATIGDRAGMANVHLGIGDLADRKGDNATALAECEVSLRLFREAGHRSGEAMSLSNIGLFLAELGEYDRAMTCCEQGLALHRELGDPRGLAGSWYSLGVLHQRLGRNEESLSAYAEGIAVAREVGDMFIEATMLHRSGDVHLAAGRPGQARASWGAALPLFDRLGHHEAEQIRYKLRHG